MISAGIIGGTGYTGKYLLKYCSEHKEVKDFTVYAKNSAGEKILNLFPDLYKQIENQTVEPIDSLSKEHDVYFISLPHGEALNYVPELFSAGKKIIDLGGDYRLDSKEAYHQWYKYEHTSAGLLSRKYYGLADYVLHKYNNEKLIANPGCYPTAVLLGLLPFVKEYAGGIINIASVAYSGTSGAGKSPKSELMMTEMNNNVRAYNVLKHRHEPEIFLQLKDAGFNAGYSFTTHLLPVERGIYATSIVQLKNKVDGAMINQLYKKAYADSHFVRLRENPPELKWVTGTNFCDINISVRGSTVVILSAIDNLIKGASGQAIQNMNLLFGWENTLGLTGGTKDY